MSIPADRMVCTVLTFGSAVATAAFVRSPLGSRGLVSSSHAGSWVVVVAVAVEVMIACSFLVLLWIVKQHLMRRVAICIRCHAATPRGALGTGNVPSRHTSNIAVGAFASAISARSSDIARAEDRRQVIATRLVVCTRGTEMDFCAR